MNIQVQVNSLSHFVSEEMVSSFWVLKILSLADFKPKGGFNITKMLL